MLLHLEEVLRKDLSEKKYDLTTGNPETDAAIAQLNDILAELEEILKNMKDLETFNELLDIVRQLIDEQKGVIDDTVKEQKRDLLKDLLQ